MKNKRATFFVLCIFVILTVITFHKYFFSNLVPFPANLMVSFYSPWRYEQWKEYANGPPNKPIGFDVLKLFYPYRKFTTEQLNKGIIPLWNPYNFAGNVHLATYQSAVLYPLNLIYHVLPLIDAWSFLVILQPVLAGFFTYLFLKSFNLSFKSSLFGGVVFAFSGWMMVWSEESLVIEHAALWLPLSLFAIEKLTQSRKRKFLLLLMVSLTLSILAGFLQMTMYHFLAAFAYGMYRIRTQTESRKKFFGLVGTFIGAVAVSAIHVVPSIESFLYSPRGIVDARYLFNTYLMKPWYIITFFSPDFWGNPGTYNFFGDAFYHEKIIFIGIPAFLLALYALFMKGRWGELRFFKWLTLIVVFLGFFPGGWILYFIKLPIISAMIPSRIFFLLTFSLSILAAYGMERFLSASWDHVNWRFVLLISSYVMLAGWTYVLWQQKILPTGKVSTISFRNMLVPSAIFLLTVSGIWSGAHSKRIKTPIYILLLITSIFSSVYFASKFLYFSERAFVFPELPVLRELKNTAGYNRVWGYGNGYIEKNITTYYGLNSPEGYDALYSQRYGELLFTQEKNGVITDQILRTDANIKQASEREGVLDNRYRARLLSLLSVKYILEVKKGDNKELSITERRFPPSYFTSIWEDNTYRIWEYEAALPRTFIAHDYSVLTDKQAIADAIFDERTDLKKRIILEKKLPVEFDSNCLMSGTEEQATLVKYEANSLIIQTNASCDGLLFISDNYYPGWKAYIDGAQTEIYRADYSFRAILIQKGSHTVIFKYDPISFKIGVVISVLSLIVVSVFIIRRKP